MTKPLVSPWFPALVVASTLPFLGGARSPMATTLVTLAICLSFLFLSARAATTIGLKALGEHVFERSNPWFVLALPAYAALQTLICFVSSSPDVACSRVCQGTLHLFALAIFYLMASSAAADSRPRRFLVTALVLIGTCEAVYGLLNLLAGNERILFYDRPKYFESATGTFYSKNQFAFLIEMVLPLSVVMMLKLRRRRAEARDDSDFGKVALLATANVAMILALVFSRSRMGMISLLGATTLVIIASRVIGDRERESGGIRRAAFTIVGFAVVSLVFASAIGIGPVLGRFADFEHDQTLGRWPLWKATMSMAAERPITGHGWGTFESVISRYRDRPTGVYFDHAHNEYLEIFAESGIIGLAITALLVAAFARRFVAAVRCRAQAQDRFLILGLSTGIVSVLLHSTADFGLRVPALSLTFLILCAVFSQATGAVVGRSAGRGSRRRS